MDETTREALRWALEAERAFGITSLAPSGTAAAAAESGTSAEADASANPPPAVALAPTPKTAETSTVPQAAPQTQVAATSGPPTLESIAQNIAQCRACALADARHHTVPGEGPATARLMFVGEAPGEHEDQSGRPFVGNAGALLTKMIGAMGLSREEVFIGNVLKCRPPRNRAPEPEEARACFHFLEDQIDLLRPRVIVALGAHAANNLLERDEPMYKLRGRVFSYRGIDLIPTYHPSFLLRKPEMKRKAWEDLQRVMAILADDRA